MHITEADDRDRPADGEADIFDVEFVARDASLAGLVRIDMRPAAKATRFLAAVLRPGLDAVVVIDHDLPLARRAFEFRASGVWTEFCCVQPLDHWTIALEAFGLALPMTGVVTPDSFGDRVAVGLDLDLETTAAPLGEAGAFSIDVEVHGEVLIADGRYEIDAVGVRRRRVGDGRPSSRVVNDHPELLGELAVGWPVIDGRPAVERRGWFGGSRPGWTALPVQSDGAAE